MYVFSTISRQLGELEAVLSKLASQSQNEIEDGEVETEIEETYERARKRMKLDSLPTATSFP